MSKYLFIDGSGLSLDYAALTFEDNFDHSRDLELWNKSNKAGKMLDYEEGDIAFSYEALDLDDDTMERILDNMDYDDSKHENYFKVKA